MLKTFQWYDEDGKDGSSPKECNAAFQEVLDRLAALEAASPPSPSFCGECGGPKTLDEKADLEKRLADTQAVAMANANAWQSQVAKLERRLEEAKQPSERDQWRDKAENAARGKVAQLERDRARDSEVMISQNNSITRLLSEKDELEKRLTKLAEKYKLALADLNDTSDLRRDAERLAAINRGAVWIHDMVSYEGKDLNQYLVTLPKSDTSDGFLEDADLAAGIYDDDGQIDESLEPMQLSEAEDQKRRAAVADLRRDAYRRE